MINKNDKENFERKKIEFRNGIFEWCLRNAEHSLKKNNFDETLKWDFLAARIAHIDCSILASSRLESHLISVASKIIDPNPNWIPRNSDDKHWLHVVSVATSIGGHTAMLRNLIKLAPSSSKHSVVLIEKHNKIPNALLEIVENFGGKIFQINSHTSFVKKAIELREIIFREADAVMLHTSPFDVIPTVAMGIPGGPPVTLVNHAAHIFWVGVSISDLVLNCRGSNKEKEWTTKYRHVDYERSKTLPIPLESNFIEEKNDASIKDNLRKNLGLNKNSKLILTVGRAEKYTPFGEINFLKIMERILDKNKDIFLLAIGPKENHEWAKIKNMVNGRVIAIGEKNDWKDYLLIADIYVEGFPFGSTTALLEAGIYGIPCVLPPKACPPPFVSDGIAIDFLEQPDNIAAYEAKITSLLENRSKRLREGQNLYRNIKAHHTGSGWVNYFNKIKTHLPLNHKIYKIKEKHKVPVFYAKYWSSFISRVTQSDYFVATYNAALELNLKPKIDKTLYATLRKSKAIRGRNFIGNSIASLCGFLSYLLPQKFNKKLNYGLFRLVGDGGILIVIRNKIKKTINTNQRHSL